MKQDSMLEALRQKKAQGLDITITIGKPEDGQSLSVDENGNPSDEGGLLEENQETPADEASEQESRDLDQAPEATQLGDDEPKAPDMPADQNPALAGDRKLFQDEMAKAKFGKGSLASMKNKQLSKTKV